MAAYALEASEATMDRLRAAGVSAEGHSDHPACDEAGGGRLSGLDCGPGEIRERRRQVVKLADNCRAAPKPASCE